MRFELHNKSVIFLLKSFVLGGAEKQALFLAAYLQNERNCDVYIYSYIQSESRELFDNECEKYQLKNLYVVDNPLSASGKFKYLKRRIKLYLFGKKLRKHQPDIIIPYLNPPSIIANVCYKIAGAKKTFWHHRGVDYYRKDPIEKLAAKRAQYFIANSKNGAGELKNELEIQNKKTYSLANFSTIESTNQLDRESIKKKYHIPENSLVIGMIAHFREEKRQEVLLETSFNLFEFHPNIHLVLVGNEYFGGDKKFGLKFIKTAIKERELNQRVTILHDTTSEKILSAFDVGVLLSDKEGMPNVVMEYMAYELPILTNNHDGCVELLGEDYEYYTQNKTKQVEEKLVALIEDEALRKSIGKSNRERLNSKFSIENYIIKLEEILNS